MRLVWATLAEAARLAEAHAGGFEDSWKEEDFEDLLEGDGVFGYLAVDDDERPAGMILCRTAAGEMEVLTIAVPAAARRRGVAKALLAAAFGVARQAGVKEAFLEVAVDNAPAASLYAGLGFRRSGLRKAYYDRGPRGFEDALVMRLDLGPDAP
jgi:ribosomal-protein-alanine N-acetyltransferase